MDSPDLSVWPVRHADGVTRWFLTGWGRLSRFRPYSTVSAANRMWCSRAVPDVAGMICRRFATGQGEQVASLIRYRVEQDGFMRNLTTSMSVQFEFEVHRGSYGVNNWACRVLQSQTSKFMVRLDDRMDYSTIFRTNVGLKTRESQKVWWMRRFSIAAD